MTDHRTAAMRYLNDAERQIGARSDHNAAQAYASMAQARALLALADLLADTTPAKAPRKRFRITQEHMEAVARVYTEASTEVRPPTRTVADHFDVPHSTAAKWVATARRQNLVQPTGDAL